MPNENLCVSLNLFLCCAKCTGKSIILVTEMCRWKASMLLFLWWIFRKFRFPMCQGVFLSSPNQDKCLRLSIERKRNSKLFLPDAKWTNCFRKLKQSCGGGKWVSCLNLEPHLHEQFIVSHFILSSNPCSSSHDVRCTKYKFISWNISYQILQSFTCLRLFLSN